jgi:hypothetical protein
VSTDGSGPGTARPSRRTLWIAAGIGAAVIAAGVVAGVIATHEGAGVPTACGGQSLPGLLTGPEPWPANTRQLRARLDKLGLPALSAEGTALHVHQHLDVFVDGQRTLVPAYIGIQQRFLSPIHTHDPSGIIHVESPTMRRFTLGEVFGVWGVRFTPDCLGGYVAGGGKQLRVYVNGARVPGDPGKLILAAHQEIAVTYGTQAELPKPIPQHSAFPGGL